MSDVKRPPSAAEALKKIVDFCDDPSGSEAPKSRESLAVGLARLLPEARQALAGFTEDGAALIAKERRRQIEKERFTPNDDKRYSNRELLKAAQAYLMAAFHPESYKKGAYPAAWPWSLAWWKPSSDPVRNLEKAGALIAAEIDRLRLGVGSMPEPMLTHEESDWQCARCGYWNLQDRERCRSCDCLRPAANDWSWVCVQCRSLNLPDRQWCWKCQSKKADPVSQPVEAKENADAEWVSKLPTLVDLHKRAYEWGKKYVPGWTMSHTMDLALDYTDLVVKTMGPKKRG